MNEPYKWEVKPSLWEVTVDQGFYSDRGVTVYVVNAVTPLMAWYSFMNYIIESRKETERTGGYVQDGCTTYSYVEENEDEHVINIGDPDDFSRDPCTVFIKQLIVLYTSDLDVDYLKAREVC